MMQQQEFSSRGGGAEVTTATVFAGPVSDGRTAADAGAPAFKTTCTGVGQS